VLSLLSTTAVGSAPAPSARCTSGRLKLKIALTRFSVFWFAAMEKIKTDFARAGRHKPNLARRCKFCFLRDGPRRKIIPLRLPDVTMSIAWQKVCGYIIVLVGVVVGVIVAAGIMNSLEKRNEYVKAQNGNTLVRLAYLKKDVAYVKRNPLTGKMFVLGAHRYAERFDHFVDNTPDLCLDVGDDWLVVRKCFLQFCMLKPQNVASADHTAVLAECGEYATDMADIVTWRPGAREAFHNPSDIDEDDEKTMTFTDLLQEPADFASAEPEPEPEPEPTEHRPEDRPATRAPAGSPSVAPRDPSSGRASRGTPSPGRETSTTPSSYRSASPRLAGPSKRGYSERRRRGRRAGEYLA